MARTVRLISHEGDVFEVPAKILVMSEFLNHFSDVAGTAEVELSDFEVDSDALREVLRYCEVHEYFPPGRLAQVRHRPLSEVITDPQDRLFLESLDSDRLLKVLSAAHALDVRSLKELICAYIAVTIGMKDVLELQEEFGEKLMVEEREEDWLREKYIARK